MNNRNKRSDICKKLHIAGYIFKKIINTQKESRGPKTAHWGTPADILLHSELFPFNPTLCSRLVREFEKRERRLPEIP